MKSCRTASAIVLLPVPHQAAELLDRVLDLVKNFFASTRFQMRLIEPVPDIQSVPEFLDDFVELLPVSPVRDGPAQSLSSRSAGLAGSITLGSVASSATTKGLSDVTVAQTIFVGKSRLVVRSTNLPFSL